MIHQLMFKPCLSDKYSQSCTNLKYPHFNTERTRRSSMVVGRILYLFNWRCLWYCTWSSNASWTTLASNLVSIDQLVIELWSKAAGHTVAEGAMVHGVDVELCVSYGRRCEVFCVVCLPKKCRCGSAKKSYFVGGGPQSLLSVSYLRYMVSEYNKGISTKQQWVGKNDATSCLLRNQ